MFRKRRQGQILADEKEEFWRLLKKSQLIDSSEEESDADEDDTGLTMRSDFKQANKNIEQIKKRCCVECGTCYCYSGGKLYDFNYFQRQYVTFLCLQEALQLIKKVKPEVVIHRAIQLQREVS